VVSALRPGRGAGPPRPGSPSPGEGDALWAPGVPRSMIMAGPGTAPKRFRREDIAPQQTWFRPAPHPHTLSMVSSRAGEHYSNLKRHTATTKNRTPTPASNPTWGRMSTTFPPTINL
jgi:hypothetical protein